MKAQDAIKLAADMSSGISMGYLNDLSDADLLHRPAPACNHINWQLGHLIVAENQIVEKVAPGKMPALPADFAEKYTPETAKKDDAKSFYSKADLLRIHGEQRAASLAALAKTSEADLDKPSGMEWAPTIGAALSAATGGHWLMHVGQWAVVRRQLGRAPLF
jgi:hypothetical protein